MTAGRPQAGRTRLTHAVVAAAAALLVLKLVALVLAPTPDGGTDDLPTFARVLALARSNPGADDPVTTGSVPDKPKEKTPVAAAAPAPPAPPAEPAASQSSAERAILERLGERRDELQRRARELETREKLLEESERRLDSRQASAEERPPGDGKPAGQDPDAAAAMRGLVTMYETMKPKDAARVFDRLPQDVLVAVVRLINPRKMAEILAAMSSESAERLTVALARRPRGPEELASAAGGLPPGELQAVELPPQARAPRR